MELEKKTLSSIAMIVVFLVLSIILWSAIFFNYKTQKSLIEANRIHGLSKQLATDLADASDYLTDEARKFAVTGDIRHLENYWIEIDETQTRDNVIKALRELDTPDAELDLLRIAKQNSDALVATETRSMRLVLTALGVPQSQYPAPVANWQLSTSDQFLSGPQKRQLATDIMFDAQYDADKAIIMGPIAEFKKQLLARTSRLVEQSTVANKRSYAVLVVTSILVMMTIITVFLFYQFRIRGKLKEVTSSIVASTSEILATVEQQERTSIQQAASVEQTATNLGELKTLSDETAAQAKTSADAAADVQTQITKGASQVNETHLAANSLEDNMQKVTEAMNMTVDKVQQIEKLSRVVHDVANQTNMLALNAAVEASQAGEDGAGFSVIASEIKTLAEQTKGSSIEIRQIIEQLVSSANGATKTLGLSREAVQNLLETSSKSDAVFGRITEISNLAAENAEQIQVHNGQQTEGVQEVSRVMGEIRSGAQQMADGIAETRIALRMINDEAKRLRSTV